MSSAAEPEALHQDPVTGEMISKRCVRLPHICGSRWANDLAGILCSELKRRQKARDKDAKKAAKPAPAAPAAAAGASTKKAEGSAAEDESNLTPNVRSYFHALCARIGSY